MHHVEIRWLSPDELTVLPKLQRKLSAPRAARIAASWDIELLGVLEGAELVGPEGETIIHLIDGQTRGEAARLYGEREGVKVMLPVAVYTSLDEQQIASQFLARNRLSSKVAAYDSHVVGLIAEDPLALLVERGMERTPFRFARKPDQYEVAAVGTVTRFTKKAERRYDSEYAEDNIVSVLALVRECFQYDQRGQRVNADILESLNWMLNEYSQLRNEGPARERLVEALKKDEPEGWMNAGKQIITDGTSSGARYVGICKVWTDAYNKGITRVKPKLAKLDPKQS